MLFVAFRKLISTAVAVLIPGRAMRHKVRYVLHPLNDRRCTAYFRHKYVRRTILQPQPTAELPKEGTEHIWQCWLQGRDAAPPLVDFCLRSVEQHRRPNQQIALITEENYAQYVHLPPFIVEKRRNGQIVDAQFSDLLRIYLLATYGGYWIDATCLLTAPIPDWIDKAPFFMFRSHGEFAYTQIQSCFIRAKANTYLVQRWRQLMEELWRNEPHMLHYFQFHLMFKAMITADERAASEYQQMPQASETATQTLFFQMRARHLLSQQMIEDAARHSFIHKLTYKIAVRSECFEIPTS